MERPVRHGSGLEWASQFGRAVGVGALQSLEGCVTHVGALVRSRRTVRLVIVAWVIAGCEAKGIVAEAQSTAGVQAPSLAAATGTVEFDLPAEYSARAADGSFVVSLMQAGFFDASSLLLRVVDIPRDSIQVSGSNGRATVPILQGAVRLRLRGVSATGPGAWSPAVDLVTVPGGAPSAAQPAGRGRAATRERPPARQRATARARNIDPNVLARRPALAEAVAPLLSADFPQSEALSCFGRVQDLAAAAVLAKTHSLSFPDLCKALRANPDASLVGALKTLKPSLDAAGAVRKAEMDARTLLRRPRRVAP